jgi:hypothetical protein
MSQDRELWKWEQWIFKHQDVFYPVALVVILFLILLIGRMV